jgi:hypothetical protein
MSLFHGRVVHRVKLRRNLTERHLRRNRHRENEEAVQIARHLQRFLSNHNPIANLHNFPRHCLSSNKHRSLRTSPAPFTIRGVSEAKPARCLIIATRYKHIVARYSVADGHIVTADASPRRTENASSACMVSTPCVICAAPARLSVHRDVCRSFFRLHEMRRIASG